VTKSLLKTGIYRHYKGRLYEVMDIARLEQTLELMVVYRALYDAKDKDFGPNALWVRSLSVFVETVNIAGKEQPRFEFVSAVLCETPHLILRPVQTEDFEALCVLDGDPDVRSYFPEGVLNSAEVLKELDRYINGWDTDGFGLFAAIDKESNKLIGRCGFAKLSSGEVEFGYLFLPQYWGQGYATEAGRALLRWAAKNIPVDHIIGFAPTNHIASLRVLEKCGMKFLKMDTYRNIECAFYKFEFGSRYNLNQ
jgi:ribosomal-protein-alanine N-acetyltransferase